MPAHDVVVAGASAGGVEALMNLMRPLPPDLRVALCVVMHMPASADSHLPEILARVVPLPVVEAKDGDRLERGQIYVGPPDRDLLIEPGFIRLSRGPRENGHRPSIDALFRSAANHYGPRVVGVVLSGTLDDGTSGLMAIKQAGGVAIVQDPEDALFSGMPRSALNHVDVDYRLPATEIASVLERLASELAEEKGAESMTHDHEQHETNQAARGLSLLQCGLLPAMASGFTCPECGGALWELRDRALVRYQCRVGHGFSSEGLLESESASVEAALWVALRTLKEKEALLHRLAGSARERDRARATARFEKQIGELERQQAIIEQALATGISIAKEFAPPEAFNP